MRLATAGVTLMDVAETGDGQVRVRCPQCGLEWLYRLGETPERFEHVNSECAIATVIELAIEAYRYGLAELRS